MCVVWCPDFLDLFVEFGFFGVYLFFKFILVFLFFRDSLQCEGSDNPQYRIKSV